MHSPEDLKIEHAKVKKDLYICITLSHSPGFVLIIVKIMLAQLLSSESKRDLYLRFIYISQFVSWLEVKIVCPQVLARGPKNRRFQGQISGFHKTLYLWYKGFFTIRGVADTWNRLRSVAPNCVSVVLLWFHSDRIGNHPLSMPIYCKLCPGLVTLFPLRLVRSTI